MKLHAYLQQENITPKVFAERLQALGLSDCSESGVRKWAYGTRTPRSRAMTLIQTATENHVTPADFFDTTSASDDVATVAAAE